MLPSAKAYKDATLWPSALAATHQEGNRACLSRACNVYGLELKTSQCKTRRKSEKAKTHPLPAPRFYSLDPPAWLSARYPSCRGAVPLACGVPLPTPHTRGVPHQGPLLKLVCSRLASASASVSLCSEGAGPNVKSTSLELFPLRCLSKQHCTQDNTILLVFLFIHLSLNAASSCVVMGQLLAAFCAQLATKTI